MRLSTGLVAFMAAMAFAAPAPSDGFGEVQLFKRDSVLDTRDLELAEMHGVNLTEMYKHSVMKRDDGDHVTIWVDRSFMPAEGPDEDPKQVEKRQSARLTGNADFIRSGSGSLCNNRSYRSITSGTSPFSGGALAIARWGDAKKGEWTWANTEGARSVVVGGSNAGRNARYHVTPELTHGEYGGVGSRDMANTAWKVYNDFAKQYSGKWRAAGNGNMWCSTVVQGSVFPARRWSFWELISTPAVV